MPTYRAGRHEHGQNFLIDSAISGHIIGLVGATCGPVIEIGPGRGALTLGLQDLGRRLTAVEIDPGHVKWLRRRVGTATRVVHADFLTWRLPAHPHVIVGNLPFHLTTAILRKILHAPAWTDAVLLVQWEVARRRAGIGGASMMTAQWSPWVDFAVHARVPAEAFRPRPAVDAGLLGMTRRNEPLLDPIHRRRYRGFVHAVFTGRGRGLPAILSRVCRHHTRDTIGSWLAREHLGPRALPKDLTAEQWAALFELVHTGPDR